MRERDAIQEALNLYSWGCSKADWPLVMGLFQPDGVWHVAGQQPIAGRAAIEQAMAAFIAGMDWFMQVNSPATIRIHGETATTRTIIRECGKFRGRDEALEAMGFCEDELVNTREGWKFARKSFTGAGLHRVALVPGPALGMFPGE